MAQLNIYVSDELGKWVRQQAKARGKSLSAFLTDLLTKNAAAPGKWNDEFFTRAVGGWSGDFPEIERDAPETRDAL